ncbi:MAG: hypothetical protein UX35_C0002G0030 [Microgenomates group bacterium GW2011_GWA1_46_15]|nr:MAG: hypothetical protein UX00_C0010G0015 [Microgenomates group bacterium GW2011_GWB1_45_17]KKU23577.1 MAG: hypothetical protein UX36_C0004G0030 [Microgenomates group bacterium GW2011_GWC1_46_15]KKU24296.1 MAG: hypothetical protein UX35_C0002G0030 [Microgenomates group bacterium GW2011_GWA1_46_15]
MYSNVWLQKTTLSPSKRTRLRGATFLLYVLERKLGDSTRSGCYGLTRTGFPPPAQRLLTVFALLISILKYTHEKEGAQVRQSFPLLNPHLALFL